MVGSSTHFLQTVALPMLLLVEAASIHQDLVCAPLMYRIAAK